jgi:hypothetical protein
VRNGSTSGMILWKPYNERRSFRSIKSRMELHERFHVAVESRELEPSAVAATSN